ncbi:MAG: caspase family protein [Gammaproteobacteria bacterium]|nr:caspase family protein [Gammaproteobacteria bacterium]
MNEQKSTIGENIAAKTRKSFILLITLFGLLLSGLVQFADAAEERRMALLIGNADYYFAPLKNPLNDATDLGDRLASIGFETKVIANPGYKRFRSEIRSFYHEVSKDPETLSVFYYAGHAIQMNNVNYMIAVDSRIADQQSLINGSISINDLLRDMVQTTNQQNLIILDACRDNPFKAINSEDQSRGIDMPDDTIRDLQQGLAPVEAPAGTIIAYATAPGGVAKDGKGRNGTYTKYLLAHLDEQRPVEEVFKRVRKDVVTASRGKQIPWEHSSLSKTIYFYPPRNEEIPDIGGF